jgi:hypothetical protein
VTLSHVQYTATFIQQTVIYNFFLRLEFSKCVDNMLSLINRLVTFPFLFFLNWQNHNDVTFLILFSPFNVLLFVFTGKSTGISVFVRF